MGSDATHIQLLMLYGARLDQLKKPPANPFDGDPELFPRWYSHLMRKLDAIRASPMDRVDVLEANSTGEPRKLILQLSAGEHVDENTLQTIQRELKFRYGLGSHRARALHQRLSQMEKITGDDAAMSRGL